MKQKSMETRTSNNESIFDVCFQMEDDRERKVQAQAFHYDAL
jgi:hypothetical protein